MTRLQFSVAASLVAAATAATAAPNKVCMGGNLAMLNALQVRTCQQQADQLRAAADKSGASNWHFVLVCDEASWQDYAAFSQLPAESLAVANADTNAAQRTTFVRASRLSSSDLIRTELSDIARFSKPAEVADVR